MPTYDQIPRRDANMDERARVKASCATYARHLSALQPIIITETDPDKQQDVRHQISAIKTGIENNVGSNNFRIYLREQAREIDKGRADDECYISNARKTIEALSASKNPALRSRAEDKQYDLDKFIAKSSQRYLSEIAQNSFAQGFAITLQ